jgi:hypothetical protein
MNTDILCMSSDRVEPQSRGMRIYAKGKAGVEHTLEVTEMDTVRTVAAFELAILRAIHHSKCP